MPNKTATVANIHALLRRLTGLGGEAGRVRLPDVFRNTWPLKGGESVRESMAKGCPVVALQSIEMPALDLRREPAMLAQDWGGFCNRAILLLRDPPARAEAARAAVTFARRMTDPSPFRKETELAMMKLLACAGDRAAATGPHVSLGGLCRSNS